MNKLISYIKYYENIIDEQTCDILVKEDFIYETSTYSSHTNKNVIKKNRVVSGDFWIRKDNIFFDVLRVSFENTLKLYSSDFSNAHITNLTDFRISRYKEGGFMSKHVDNIHHSHGQQFGYPQVTALLFINDDYEGGEFIISNKIFKTKKGSVLVFPSNFMYPHEVLKVSKGTRYSITCWML